MLMTPASNIFLVGPMACGKTTLGRHLAERLGHEFLDSDEVIQQRAGLSIERIFEGEGEDGFRRREAEIIAELTKKENIVLATGGGSVLSEENRRRLQQRGTVVHLQIGIDAQLARTSGDPTRPLLKNQNKRAVLEKLNRQREDCYRRIANITLDVDNKNVDEISDEIINALPHGKTDA